MNIALQLYSIRDRMNEDFAGTLERVAAIGYKGVEFAGYGGFSPQALKDILDRTGLVTCAAHIGIDALEKDLDGQLAYARTLGFRYLVCPGAPTRDREEVLSTASRLSAVAARLSGTGIGLAYHNHSHEFFPTQGGTGLDLLFERTAVAGVLAEHDTYWVQFAKQNPRNFLKKYSGRVPLIHIKDMDASGTHDTAIGEGIMDIRGICAQAMESGTEWVVVEQETYDRPSIECVALGFENLKRMGLVD